MVNDAELKVRITAELASIKAALDGLQAELRDTATAGKKAGDGTSNSIDRIAQTAKRAALALGGMAAVYATIRAGTGIVKAADDMQRLEARLKLATKSEQEYAKARDETYRVAQQTGQQLGGVVDLYTKLARSTQNLGIDQNALVRVMETVNKTVSLSGASSDAAAASMLQFGQALSGPKFQAEELNSIIEQTPELARAIERGLGIQQGTLKRYAIEVGLSGRQAIAALLKVSGEVDNEFAKLPRTVSQAMTSIRNDFARVASSADLKPLVAELENLRAIITDPEIVAGAVAVAQAFVTGFGYAAKAVAAVGNAITLATDKNARLANYIDTLTARLQLAQDQREEALAAGDDVSGLDAQIAQLEARLGSLVGAYNEVAAARGKAADEAGRLSEFEAALAREEQDRTAARLESQGAEEAANAAANDATEDRQKKIAGLIADLEREAATTGATAAEIAQYELAQLGASAADKARAAQLSETIAALEAKAEAEKEAAKAEEERLKRIKEIPKDLADVQNEILRLTGNTAEATTNELRAKYEQLIADLKSIGDTAGVELVEKLINLSAAEARLDELRTKMADIVGEFAAAQETAENNVAIGSQSGGAARYDVGQAGNAALEQLQALRDHYQKLADEDIPGAVEALAELDATMADIAAQSGGGLARAIQDLRKEMAQMQEDFAGDAIGALRDGLTGLFYDLAEGSKSAKDALKDFARGFALAMVEIAARALATMLVLQLLDALFPGAGKLAAASGNLAAGVKHTGGIAGQGGTSRQVPGWLFAGAARYHSGGIAGASPLKPGEVPAILQRGEEVITQQDPRHAMNGGGTGGGMQNVRINLIDDRGNIGDYMSSADGERVLLETLERNSLRARTVLGMG